MERRHRFILTAALILAMLAVLPLSAGAAEIVAGGECGSEGDNLTWTLDADGLLEISGEGEMADYSWQSAPWREYLPQLKTLKLNEGITTIGGYAFYQCEELTGDVIIPEGVTVIGDGAFMNCSGLYLCTLTIPDSVTEIGAEAFWNCFLEGTLKLPAGLRTIGDRAFCGNHFSGTLTIPDSVTDIGIAAFRSNDFEGALWIPENLVSVGAEAFAACWRLTRIDADPNNRGVASCDGILYTKDFRSLIQCPAGMDSIPTIPASVIRIEDSAFCGCSSIPYGMVIPDSVERIGNESFWRCYGVVGDLPESLTSVGERAFMWCYQIKGTLHIPENLTSVGDSAFTGCTELEAFETAPGNPAYVAYEGALYSKDYSKFAVYPAGRKTKPVFHENTVSIENEAFAYCGNLKGSITIPETVRSLGAYAFLACSQLRCVYFEGDAPTYGGHPWSGLSDVFSGCAPGFTVYCLAGRTGWTVPEWNGYPCRSVDEIPAALPGDVTGDGEITAADRLILTRFLAGWREFADKADLKAADINRDGKVSPLDRVILSRYLAEWDGYKKWFE